MSKYTDACELGYYRLHMVLHCLVLNILNAKLSRPPAQMLKTST